MKSFVFAALAVISALILGTVFENQDQTTSHTVVDGTFTVSQSNNTGTYYSTLQNNPLSKVNAVASRNIDCLICHLNSQGN
ncbi:MAG: hypothetical protein HY606_14585 [Planctomycetes bacterium]|nr:hypothetical protein [Planctomycetota bacterium]